MLKRLPFGPRGGILKRRQYRGCPASFAFKMLALGFFRLPYKMIDLKGTELSRGEAMGGSARRINESHPNKVPARGHRVLRPIVGLIVLGEVPASRLVLLPSAHPDCAKLLRR